MVPDPVPPSLFALTAVGGASSAACPTYPALREPPPSLPRPGQRLGMLGLGLALLTAGQLRQTLKVVSGQ
jgi:hypothetical protein